MLFLIALYWLIGWAILLIGRIALIVFLLPVEQLLADKESFPLAIWNILRFDFQTLSYLAVLPLLTAVIAALTHKSAWWHNFVRWYYTIAYTILATLTIVDIGFYKNFNSHFNIVVFDFFNELPLTLLQTFWEDYPVLPALLCIISVFLVLHFWGKRMQQNPKFKVQSLRFKNRITILPYLLSIIFMIVCMRGSLTEFPLQIEDTSVSSVKQINDCVPNAAYALKTAWKAKKSAFEIGSPQEILAEYQFDSEKEALNTLGIDSLFTTLIHPATDYPLNIVIIFCESWSGYLCYENIDKPDVMLGMEKHLQEDLWFKNYQNVHNSTIASVENFVMGISLPRFFMSDYHDKCLSTSIVNPFKASGYRTVFMTGMNKAWENIGEGLECQGFDEVIGKNELLKKHPEYKHNSIGVYDHHLFNSLLEQITSRSSSASQSQPHMYYVLTTTNHPPYDYPDDVELPRLAETYYARKQFDENRTTLEKIISGFQYANYSMAQFLDALKCSDAAENTMVVITGDHNVRGTMRYGNAQVHKKWEHAVPLYIYLPKQLRGTADGSYSVDTNKYGCHYDILPTIAPYAFKQGVRYLNVGKNLLSDTISAINTWSYNADGILAERSNYDLAERKSRARECLLKLTIFND